MASYEIAHIIASGCHPFTDGIPLRIALLLPSKLFLPKKDPNIIHCMCPEIQLKVEFKTSPDMECQLMNIIKDNLLYYSLVLVESKDVSDTEQLYVYIRGVKKN